MWLLSNETPFAAERTWTRDEHGAEVWLVAIKASFEIDPDGKQTLLAEQVPVNMAPVFADDPNEMLDDTDFNLAKPRTDILLGGHAYAADGRPDTQTVVRLKIGDVDKSATVTGDRVFVPAPISVTTSRPQPFLKVPLSWRRAYGGVDKRSGGKEWEPRNPVGVGFATHPEHLIGEPAPNFEYPRSTDGRRPAGFGAVARHWVPRSGYAGTYGAEWEKTRDPLPPRDFDRLYHQCAPEDQQSRAPLVGHERVQLGNFTPDGFLQFLLPRVGFDLVTQFYGRPDRRHQATLHTLRLTPDERRFSITWLSALPCPFDEERLKNTTIRTTLRDRVAPAVARTGVWLG